MKHQQVVVDYTTMLKSSCVCLLLAFSGYVLLKLIQAIFYLPAHLRRNQEKLEELAAQFALKLNDKNDEDVEEGALANIPEGSNEENDNEEKKDK